MRDKERIRPLLERLEKIWKEHPDLRLGQLILNVVRDPASVSYTHLTLPTNREV